MVVFQPRPSPPTSRILFVFKTRFRDVVVFEGNFHRDLVQVYCVREFFQVVGLRDFLFFEERKCFLEFVEDFLWFRQVNPANLVGYEEIFDPNFNEALLLYFLLFFTFRSQMKSSRTFVTRPNSFLITAGFIALISS
jgi:hypothetical protein